MPGRRAVFVLRGGSVADSTRVVASVLAADRTGLRVVADDQVVLRGAAELVACALRPQSTSRDNALPNSLPTPHSFMLAVGAGSGPERRDSSGWLRGSAPAIRHAKRCAGIQTPRRGGSVGQRSGGPSRRSSVANAPRNVDTSSRRYILFPRNGRGHGSHDALKTESRTCGLV